MEGKGVSVLDMSGLAQKGGPVMSHVKIAATPDELHAARIGTGGARLVIGCDLVVTGSAEALERMQAGHTRALVNATTAPVAEFVRNPNWQLPGSNLVQDVTDACGANNAEFVPAADLATNLMGDSIATNMFMLGYAWQRGWVPLASAAIERAIELNGVAVEFNRKSFVWGRRAALDLERVRRSATPAEVIPISQHMSRNLDEIVERRARLLTDYQDGAYAERYRALVARVRSAEKRAGSEKLAEAVARYYAKLWRTRTSTIGRGSTQAASSKKIAAMFEGDTRWCFILPRLIAKPDPRTGSEDAVRRLDDARVSHARETQGIARHGARSFGRTEAAHGAQLIADYERSVDE